MKIVIDIDEVVVEFVEKYMKFIKSKGYKRVNYEDVFTYNLWEVLKLDKDFYVKLMDEFNLSNYFKKRDFIKGFKSSIKFLRDNYDIFFITARPDIIHKDSRDLIFEDSGETSLKYAKNGLRVLLLDKPWNRNFKYERIFRCMNWDDILEKIKELNNGV